MTKKIGVLREVAPARPVGQGKPSASPIYRNVLSEKGFPESLNGATTLYEVFNRSVEKFGDKKCLGRRTIGPDGKAGPFEYLTYKEVRTQARIFSSGLQNIGFKPKGKLGVFAANCREWMIAAKAMDQIAGVIVPIYDSLGATAVEYICNHSELSVALVETGKLGAIADVATKISTVKAVVYLGPGDADAKAKLEAAGIRVMSWDQIIEMGRENAREQFPPKPEDLACIMYTSGTTGTPKGVELTQRNLVAAITGATMMLPQAGLSVGSDDSLLSYLTLAHSYGRQMEEFMLSVGGSIGYWQKDIKKLMDDIAEFKPTVFVAVPRILERVADGVEAKLKKGPGVIKAAFNAALNYKLFWMAKGVPNWLAGLGIPDILFKKVRQGLGGRVKVIVSGGAPLAPHVEDFCNTCLAPVLQGYGLTETCAGTFITLGSQAMAHTVGPPLATAEFRLESCPELNYDGLDPTGAKGEVLIRGTMVFGAYHKDEAKYKAEVDDEGFFHSGDIGTITPAGCLKIIDRKKNMFKLAQGEYVAAEFLESVFSRTGCVDQIWVYGNSFQAYLVAVIVPQPWWAKKQANGLDSPEANKAMLEELLKTGKEAKLKGFEMIKAVHMTDDPFSVENDLMTQSLKLKRPQLQKKYQKEIDAMYAVLNKRS